MHGVRSFDRERKFDFPDSGDDRTSVQGELEGVGEGVGAVVGVGSGSAGGSAGLIVRVMAVPTATISPDLTD